MTMAMKTKIFGIINVISFFGMIVPMEINHSRASIFFVGVSAVIFILSASLSIWRRSIWKLAHETPEENFTDFYKENYRVLAAVMVGSVMVISITSDFIAPTRDLSLFISRLVVYLTIFLPNFYVIFKKQSFQEVGL